MCHEIVHVKIRILYSIPPNNSSIYKMELFCASRPYGVVSRAGRAYISPGRAYISFGRPKDVASPLVVHWFCVHAILSLPRI